MTTATQTTRPAAPRPARALFVPAPRLPSGLLRVVLGVPVAPVAVRPLPGLLSGPAALSVRCALGTGWPC